jgi:hypothetical protein
MSLRSLVYLCLSVVVSVVGLALVFASRTHGGAGTESHYDPVLLSVGTSLIAAGATSLLFTVVREIDLRDARRATDRLEAIIELEQDLHRNVTHVRRTLLLANDRDARRLFKAHAVQEVRSEIQSAVGTIELDGLGLSLKALYQEQVRGLLDRGNCRVRLLIEDPCSRAFSLMCEQEARDRVTMTRDVIYVTKQVSAWNATPTANAHGARLEVRWSELSAPITSTRVNDWIATRPRLPQEGAGKHGFFEQYTRDDERAFDQLERFFEEIWDDAKDPSAEDIADAERLLEKLVQRQRAADREDEATR